MAAIMPEAVAVIPARYAASRFPGKPLAPIDGVPMLRRVWEGTRSAKRVRDAIIATDDARIAEAARGFGATVVMTSSEHATGTDRLAEVARHVGDEIIVNVQGDEPLIEGFVVDAAVEALLAEPATPMATVVHACAPAALSDPNRVKVVLDCRGFALYFSRAPIPHRRAGGESPMARAHVGIYAFREPFLQEFAALPPGRLEQEEALEQLRALEQGHRIRVVETQYRGFGVDTPEDLERARELLARAGT
jgi:3-deoxy-manno-octulosonate cytidylyltransferase (CMP-KDO synthetase)